MTEKLDGRWGPYEPKIPADKAKARQQAAARTQRQTQERAWLDKHQSCASGCGRPVAFYENSPHLALKYDGYCSKECQQGHDPRQAVDFGLKVARIYLRVSTDEQDLTRQAAIARSTRAAGFYVAGIYREKASGARADRAELLRLISDLQSSEVVVVEKIDRISRLPVPEAERLVASIRAKGARLCVPGLVDLTEFTKPPDAVTRSVLQSMQDLLLKLALQMARDDDETRRDRQRQGVQLAKAAHKYRGRIADTATHERIIALRCTGLTIQRTAELAGCSASQVKRIWALQQAAT